MPRGRIWAICGALAAVLSLGWWVWVTPRAQGRVALAQTGEIAVDPASIARFRHWIDARRAIGLERETPQRRDGAPPIVTTWPGGRIEVPHPRDVNAGEALAIERRRAMLALIERDPRRAIEEAVEEEALERLPPEVARHIERPIDGEADVRIVARLGYRGGKAVSRVLQMDGRSLEMFAAEETYLRSVNNAKVEGIELGGKAAIGNLKLLKNQKPGPKKKPVARRPVLGNDGAGEGGPVAGSLPGGTTGVKRILLIRTRFTNQSGDLFTESAINVMMNAVNSFYVENSGNKTSLTWTITPTLVLNNTAQWYKDNDPSGYGQNVLDDARAKADLAGYDWENDYELEAVMYSDGPGQFSGQAFVGMRGCWLRSTGVGIAAHEFGHNFGNYHANFWRPSTADNPIGPGVNEEYGDVFDTMGSAVAFAYHFNAFEKADLNWLSASGVRNVTTSGIYRVHAHDLGTLDGNYYALKIAKDVQRDYWIEFRQHAGWTSQPWIWNGVGLRWGRWAQSHSGSQLIDVNPGTPEGKSDSPIVIGQTFTDPYAKLHITPLAKGGTAPESMDVYIHFGDPPGNGAPSLSLSASATTVSPGTLVTITANATDPDGDTVAYQWDLGDRTFGPNAPVVTKSWLTAGNYRVRCTVSDMKGKKTTKSITIRVGTPAGFTISGKVLNGNGQPLADVRVHNGAPLNDLLNHRFAHTDSDGTYALHNVPAGTFNMTAIEPNYSFVPVGFANPLVVGPDRDNIDFAATQATFVIRGKCTSGGAGVGGVIVSDGVRSDVTGPTGVFNLHGVPDGQYTLTATKVGHNFVSNAWANPVVVNGADVINRNFVSFPPGFTVSGQIQGAPPGTTVTVTDGFRMTTAQADGTYSLFLVPAGTWHIRATAPGMSFSPAGWSNPLTVTAATPNKHFMMDAVQKWSISGKVTDLGDARWGTTVSSGAVSVLTDTAGQYYIAGLANGAYVVTASEAGQTFAPALHNVTINDADVSGRDFATTNVDAPPTITVAAAANPNPVPGTKTNLSVLGADDGGEDLLWYSWSVLGTPPAPVSFTVNNAHAAKETVATFTKAGTYTFRASVFDERGGMANSDVVVEVLQTPTSIAVTPLDPTIMQAASQQFTAALKDQFSHDLPSQPGFAWAVDGGGTIDAAGLFTSNGTLGAFTVTASGGGLEGESVVKVKAPPGPGSGVTRELFTGIGGAAVADLTAHASFPHAPASANVVADVFEASASADEYGQRLRGWFVAPGDGQYVFYIASDDRGELYLSTDDSPANKVKIAEVPGFTPPRVWTTYPAQKSAAIALVGGQKYYIEALQKEADGGDHVAVGVETPGGVEEKPIPANRLIPLPIVSVAATTAQTAEGSSTPGRFTVTRSGATAGELVVNLTLGGTATAGGDYTPISTSVTILNGASSATIDVATSTDTESEGDETVTVTLLNGSLHAIGADRSASVTILDDDLLVTIAATDPQATEPIAMPALPPGWENYRDEFEPMNGPPLGVPDTGTFTITLSKPILVDRVIGYTVSGTATPELDYQELGGTVTIPAGQTSAQVNVVPLADEIDEIGETVQAELSAGSGYTLGAASSATVIIGDGSAAAPILTASALDGRRVFLEWNDALANEDGFEVQRLIGGDWTTVHTSAAGATQFIHEGLTPAMPHTYRVRGVRAGQSTDWSNAANATTWKPGDATGDGKVNFTDFQRVEVRYGKSPAAWSDGDFSGDGAVGYEDFVILFNHFGN